MLPAVSFISVLPDHGEGIKTMTERSAEIQHLKNQLNQYKLQNDLLGHQLENHRQQMSDVLQDKSILAEELTQKTAHLKSLQAQVEYQTEQREVNLQKLADLNSRVEYMQSRKQDAIKTLKLQSVLIAKTKQECAYIEKRTEYEKKRIEELKAENAQLKRSRAETTQAKARETTSAATTKGIGRAELMMLQGAHNEISALTAQSERLNQEIDQLKGVVNSMDIRKRINEWQKKSEELVEHIEQNEASLSRGQPHLLKIAKAILAGEYDDDAIDCSEAKPPDPKPARPSGMHSTRDPVSTQKEVTMMPDQSAAMKLLAPLAESMLRPMRYLPGSNKKRMRAKTRRYMAMVDSFRDNLRHASRNTDNIVEALQKVLTKGSFAMFRAHFTRYRVERVWLRRQTLKQKCAYMGVTTKFKAMIHAKQKLFAAKKQAYLVTIDELEKKVKHLMYELEVKSGSECSLRTIHKFFSTQLVWLQLMVERDQNDIANMEEAIETKDPLKVREIGAEILLKKKQEKAARCLQIQTGCLNVEKDIRLLEWQQKKQNPSAKWVSPNVKWTASGDTGDADTQTDTAYVFTQKLWAGERPFSVKDMRNNAQEVVGDVEISLVTAEEFLVKCVVPIGGAQTQLFLYGNLEHVHLPDKEDAFTLRQGTLRPAQRLYSGVGKDSDAADGKPSAPLSNSRATPQTGFCLAKLLEVEYIGNAPRLRLTGQDERRDDAARSVTYLDWDCLYNDNQLYTCAIEIHGVPFLATLVQCKKTKYGMCFAHLRIYQPITSWLRWCTLNVRDFCRSLGFPTINAMTSSLGPSINEGFRKYLLETFKDDLASFDFFDEMVSVLPAIQGDVMVLTTRMRYPEKVMMINTYTRMNEDKAKETRNRRTITRKSKRVMEQQMFEVEFKASAQEVVFAKLVVTLDPDAFANVTIDFESALGADDDSLETDIAAQRAAAKKKKKEKKEKKAKRAADNEDAGGQLLLAIPSGHDALEQKSECSRQPSGAM